jgi:prolyl-tRNA synthetase
MSTTGITKNKHDNFSEWYTEIVIKLKLLDYYPVSGCYIMLPFSYEMWENIQSYLNAGLKKHKVKNVYFPLLIPETYLNKESSHIEGFTPEVIWVSKNVLNPVNKDEVKLCIRPTSETAIYPTFAKEIKSHGDLPLIWNQWCNVMRNEFTSATPFIRSKEFLWQEGHACFASETDAYQNIKDILKLYKQVYEDLLCVPVIIGKKIESEKFAGAQETFSIETFIPDANKFIQCATVHNLGKNFSKMFDIRFQLADGTTDNVIQTSWGLTTRSIGTAIMTHGDNKGLVLAPNFAPVQIVIVPITYTANIEINEKIKGIAQMIYERLSEQFRVELDSTDKTPGWKYSYWESKGVPIRIEIGPKDVRESKFMISSRATKEKSSVLQSELTCDHIHKLFETIKTKLLSDAKNKLETSTIHIRDKNDICQVHEQQKIILVNLCESKECDEFVRNNYHMKPICRPIVIDTLCVSNVPLQSCCICGLESELCYLGKTF